MKNISEKPKSKTRRKVLKAIFIIAAIVWVIYVNFFMWNEEAMPVTPLVDVIYALIFSGLGIGVLWSIWLTAVVKIWKKK